MSLRHFDGFRFANPLSTRSQLLGNPYRSLPMRNAEANRAKISETIRAKPSEPLPGHPYGARKNAYGYFTPETITKTPPHPEHVTKDVPEPILPEPRSQEQSLDDLDPSDSNKETRQGSMDNAETEMKKQRRKQKQEFYRNQKKSADDAQKELLAKERERRQQMDKQMEDLIQSVASEVEIGSLSKGPSFEAVDADMMEEEIIEI